MTATVRLAESEADLSAVRDLCWKYRNVLLERTRDRPELLDYYYTTAVYGTLLATLEEEHARPAGAIFLAELDGHVVGCGMFRTLEPGVCEIKRVYVEDTARGRGVGQAICKVAMAQARADGFHTMKLDTISRLPEAVSLYEGMGFLPCAPFHSPPPEIADDILFYQHPL